MTGYPLQGRPGACCRDPFSPLNSAFLLRYTYETPIFWLGRTRLNGIISPPYPEVTLDNFDFPVDGRLASRRAVFRSPGRILAISGQSPIAIISTLNFGLWSTKLGETVRATKKMTHIDNGPGPGLKYWETAVFTFCRKAENGPTNYFFQKRTPQIH